MFINKHLAGHKDKQTEMKAGPEADKEEGVETDKGDPKEQRRSGTRASGTTWKDLGLHKMNTSSTIKFKGSKSKAKAGTKQTGLDKAKQLGIKNFLYNTRDMNLGKPIGNSTMNSDQLTKEPSEVIKVESNHAHSTVKDI